MPALVTFVLPFEVAGAGFATVIIGPANASNTLTTPDAVVPVTFAKTFNYTAPAYSVSALTAYLV